MNIMQKIKLLCPCIFGLESVLTAEIKKIGGQDVVTDNGKVSFFGDISMIAKANIHLRTAERVLLVLGEFTAKSFTELFDSTERIKFSNYIGKNDAFPVKGYCLNSKLASVPDCQKIIKKAIVRSLESSYNLSWFEETGSVHQIQFSIFKDVCTLMLDTSGQGLHKRGYRKISNIAPIKETLAAGIVNLARVHENSVVYDPFCGSGTFLIESALTALNIAPGINRHFECEKWGLLDSNIFSNARGEAISAIIKNSNFTAFGSDIDEECVNLTLSNAKKAGVSARIKVIKADIKDFSISQEKAIVFSNPPYGERLLDLNSSRELYKTMGNVFLQKKYHNYYVISPDEEFERIFNREADKRRKLYNGMLKCQLFMYYR